MLKSNMLVPVKKNLDKLVVVGDRVLVRPKSSKEMTGAGLYLPPGVQEKEKIQSGYILKVGPGYPIPMASDDHDEPWKDKKDKIKYVPLQAKVGDEAIYLQNNAWEINYNNEKLYIVPQSAILLLVRDEDLFG